MLSNHFNYYVSPNACFNIVESKSFTCISFQIINSHWLSRCWKWVSSAIGLRMINLEILECNSLLFSLCTTCQIAHTKFIINFYYKNRGHRKNDPKTKPQMDGPCSISDSEACFFFNNRVFLLPAIVLLIHLSSCMTWETKPESWSISSKCASKFPTLSFMTSLFCLHQM